MSGLYDRRMPRTRSGSLQSLRRANQERLLTLLLRKGPTHRAELARRADLSRTTVSTIVTELITRGLVIESDGDPDADGRAKETLAINPGAAVALGLDFTFDHVWVHLSDLAHNEIAGAGRAVDPDLGWAERIDIAADLLDGLIAQHGLDRDRFVGAGVGLPGPIEKATGIVSTSLPDQPWSHVHAADEFQRRLQLPVAIENNTRLEAVAEAYSGAGRGVRDLMYVGLSSGIAAGLILDGRVFRGAVGAAGELGHTSVDVNGPACPCGNRGCLVLHAGIPAVLNALRPHLGAKATVDDVLAAAAAGDRACEGALADVGQMTGRVLTSTEVWPSSPAASSRASATCSTPNASSSAASSPAPARCSSTRCAPRSAGTRSPSCAKWTSSPPRSTSAPAPEPSAAPRSSCASDPAWPRRWWR
jgi:predicted NBD/HSP70 family sugar kinase